jgi:serine/threonine-protein kinase
MAPGGLPLPVGEVIAGKYRIEHLLGQGGMGVVLAGRHVHLEERVAIKLMLSEAAFNNEAVARFLREARAAARLESAHVARVSDVGTLADGRPYMVMEYLDGSDLSQVLAQQGPLPIQDAVDYLLQASEAIAEAHSIGIVHRDLKPSNLFLTRRRDRTPHVKVLDFGISKVANVAGSADSAMTRTSAMMGSPLYMSPEQMTSVRDVDGRSDIWALGIILYELLAGRPPFEGESLPQVCAAVLQGQAASLLAFRRDVPQELDAIVARCLAKTAAHRFQDIASLAMALRPFAGRHSRASLERIVMLSGGEHMPPSAAPPAVAISQQGHPGYPVAQTGNPYPVAQTGNPYPVAQTGNPAAAAASVQAASGIRGTNAAWGETRPPSVPKMRSPLPIVAGLVLVPLLGAGAWWAFASQAAQSPTPEGSVAVVTGAEPPPSAPIAAPQAPEVASAPPSPAPSATEAPTPASATTAPTPPVAAKLPSLGAVAKPQVPAAPSKPAAKSTFLQQPQATPAPVAAPTPAPTPAQPSAPVVAKPAEVKKPVGMGGRL